MELNTSGKLSLVSGVRQCEMFVPSSAGIINMMDNYVLDVFTTSCESFLRVAMQSLPIY